METEVHLNNQQRCDTEHKETFNRVRVSPDLYSIYLTAETILNDRNTKTTFVEFTQFLAHSLDSNLCERFIEEKTPLEYRLKELLADPNQRGEIEKFIEKQISKKKGKQ